MEINFTGDVFLDRPYTISFVGENYISNLEYPITKNLQNPTQHKVNLHQPSSFIKDVFGIGIRGICSLNLLISPVLDVSLEAFVNEPPDQSIQVNVTITAIKNTFLKHT